jgi:hypothetical protein
VESIVRATRIVAITSAKEKGTRESVTKARSLVARKRLGRDQRDKTT